jgi:hypothetical protein
VAGVIAEGQAMPFARADVSIDTVPTPAEIDRALARLETLAKSAEPLWASHPHCRFPSNGLEAGQSSLRPRSHAGAVDNGDAETKIKLDALEGGTGFPARRM